jgi:hypothetical protein
MVYVTHPSRKLELIRKPLQRHLPGLRRRGSSKDRVYRLQIGATKHRPRTRSEAGLTLQQRAGAECGHLGDRRQPRLLEH